MKAVYDLELPYDVAVTTSDNDSCFIVFLFSSPEKSECFYNALIFNRECNLEVFEEPDGKHTFYFQSSNSPQTWVIKTDRTLENNSQLKLITDKDYKEYSYLTCGYKIEQQVFYPQDVAYPLFLSYFQE
ncbi:MAG: hypothetical protein HC854_17035 [Flavobacterium sp.]|nr:hypothetical protein [Flavobacterium sp.]